MHSLSFAEIHDKKYHMRCEDYYGRQPERDGPVLVGIFIGRYSPNIIRQPGPFSDGKKNKKKKTTIHNFLFFSFRCCHWYSHSDGHSGDL